MSRKKSYICLFFFRYPQIWYRVIPANCNFFVVSTILSVKLKIKKSINGIIPKNIFRSSDYVRLRAKLTLKSILEIGV